MWKVVLKPTKFMIEDTDKMKEKQDSANEITIATFP